MKHTFITVLITALVTSFCWYAASVAIELQRGVERLWLMSAVKAPGRMALDNIEADLLAGRTKVAQAKITALKKQWAIFDSEAGFRGQAIGNIMVIFGQIDRDAEGTNNAGLDGAANGGQLVRSEINGLSSGDPIGRLVANFSSDKLWENGIFPVLGLPETATIDEVVNKSFKMGGLGVTGYTIMRIQQVHIRGSLPDLYTAVLVQTDSGEKIVLLKYKGSSVGWWSRICDAK